MNLTTKQDTETGILIALSMLIMGWIWQDWLYIVIAGGVLANALILPILFRPISYIWFGLARIMGYVMSHLLLIVVFFLLIIPVGLSRRWMGKDSLQLNIFKKGTDSVLEHRDHTYKPEDITNPF